MLLLIEAWINQSMKHGLKKLPSKIARIQKKIKINHIDNQKLAQSDIMHSVLFL